MDIIQSLCPDPTLWRIVLVSPRTDRIILHLEPLTRQAHCPVCGNLSRRIHSHYLRSFLATEPAAGQAPDAASSEGQAASALKRPASKSSKFPSAS